MKALNYWMLMVLISLPLPAWAGLTWKKTTIEHKAQVQDESVTALYHFANTGKKPITILSTKSSCGCTVAQLDKKTYAPGELGTMRVKFTFGDRTGQQTKQVQLYTDDPSQYTYLLTLKVDIPEFLSVEPQLIFWTRGQTPDAKSVTVKVLSPTEVKIDKWELPAGDKDYWQVELQPLGGGKAYRVSATPVDTSKSRQTKLKLVTNVGKEEPRVAYVILQVY